MVPHLTTALKGPLLEIASRFLDAMPEIERWLRGQWQEHTPPFYGSVDLRNAGFKLAPVDMNLFPGGFNNLDATFLPLCVQAAVTAILRLTGLEVRLGSLLPEVDKPTRGVELPDGASLLLEPLVRSQYRLGLDGFDPCAILLNNELSSGMPAILQNLNEQFVLPPLHAGWAVRRKSNHFAAYDQVAGDFARLVGIDPWRINPYFSVCKAVDYHERQGEECLAANVDAVLGLIREKYQEYDIDEAPYVVVKADAGTYGMGVMTVKDASQVVALNRKQRNKMSVIKEGLAVSQVIIQEGVHTYEQVGSGPQAGVAEPVVYMIDRFVVGGFYRVHGGRGRDESLNAPGMHFEPLAFETSCSLPDQCQNPDAPPNRFYAYGVVARLAQLAASLELERTAPMEEQLSCA